MMRFLKFIMLMTVAAYAVSCMDMAHEDMATGHYENVIIGNVTDTAGVAIEHIKATLKWNDGAFVETQYTNSDGYFIAEIWQTKEGVVKSLSITLEDIDGEDNGGLFESMTETLTVFEDNAIITLDFRLNHATASESSPQS